MNRRDLLRSLAAAVAIPAISGLESEALFATGRRVHRRARAGAFRLLDPHQSETVATIADMIIPATDTPGARAADVHRFIDLLLAEWFPDDERAEFLAGLADVDTRARAAFGTDLIGATEAQRTELLGKLDAEAQALGETKRNAKKHFFQLMKSLTVYGYFTSEAGATGELHFVAIPGSFDGCASLDHTRAAPGDF
jgi:hypothetical protein